MLVHPLLIASVLVLVHSLLAVAVVALIHLLVAAVAAVALVHQRAVVAFVMVEQGKDNVVFAGLACFLLLCCPLFSESKIIEKLTL